MALLEARGIDKRFGAHYALSGVSLAIEPGEVHALVGENGAGKSTFIKIVTGVYKPDGGELWWQGKQVTVPDPKTARELGINVIHQDRQLVPAFTGLENLYLGLPYPKRPFGLGVRWGEMRERASQTAARLGIEVPLDVPASDMSPPERTMLEILRAMMLECRLLILDEPTAALTDREAELLFSLIGRLQSQGTAIVYVSHRMDEIFRLSDRITVLRNGKLAGTLTKQEATRDKLIALMTDGKAKPAGDGSVQAAPRRASATSAGPVILRAAGIATADGRVKRASLEVRGGEVVGLFGLAGAGRTELLEAVYGLRTLAAGELAVAGERVQKPAPKKSLNRGIVLIPEDRRGHALIMGMTIRENMTLPVLSSFSDGVRIRAGAERSSVSRWMTSMNVKAAGAEQPVGELSGGNQQKVVFAKALMSEPKLFLCDEPTQAVDVMTREEIHRLLRDQADNGRGVLFVSSDLQEVLEIADRIVLMHGGETIAELPNDGVLPEDVLKLIYNQEKGSEPKHGSV
ncbi:sugar ABC transporter ATP-binding protein [Paenibacillus oceani]|uniref:Sugar ABC transporter ATP-binding protein n=1 Tax=Paenibacillus oceani TaxID=2772510 RepID=A0A927H4V5_9BACL|nr:sugar ABC transporter ATP-binding protein [Paenibacillus oceani]MBD2866899.1 sugar ABC transporter ATP-binding protein [Paenibacillus oceani]